MQGDQAVANIYCVKKNGVRPSGIDAFAGAGFRTIKHEARDGGMIGEDTPARVEPRRGSAMIAIDTVPVMFLDPYGMDVDWETLEAISRTKAIDV